ncbi:hypothetical protein E4634_13600 [Mangrovimicrobium sediminis]|uniref:Uncharacterized protein n=1 Tax=Mangrovimicrobium sediminis TaxID=2562682 RepID=A0A4Z0LZE4_9GAMM|nr:hypothetical protein [Haliea sp. SAOS-164]TGD72556.1 hypothetical protein E4634_13600 [Haliea sp. SAOS-164]
MLTANKLEKIIELEDNLRAEYQSQLEARDAEIESLKARQAELEATVAQQLETITGLSEKATANQRTEQLNRELNNRSEKLQDEAAELKKRVKALQKDLGEVRDENKALKQFDPPRMKKNLDANKKKLAEKTRAADALQKSLNQSKAENAELQRKLKGLEEQVAASEAEPETEEREEAA